MPRLTAAPLAAPGIALASALALGSLAAGPARAGSALLVSAYAYPPSVAQGESLGIYVSTNAETFDLRITREGATPTEVLFLPDRPGVYQLAPDSAWAYGCDWERSLTIKILDTWPSGVYVIAVTIPPGLTKYAVFTVRENHPGSTGRILVQCSITTWQAYNDWGGNSLYPSASPGRGHVVSFRRPYALTADQGDFWLWELPLIRWLEEQGYDAEYCTSLDLHADPLLLRSYDVFVSVGHDEYWSQPMRAALEEQIADGGHVLFLGGNTSWWQVRFSEDLSRMICYKSAALDPLTGVVDSLVTVNWFDPPVLRPENPVTGLSFRNGGYVNYYGWYPVSEGYGGYTAHRTDHWAYEGTGLAEGQEFGQEAAIVGHEVDGALVTWEDSLPYVTGEDGTPLGFTILATSPASRGLATMGLYTAPSGAVVFNAATIRWSAGLATDTTVSRITFNVLNELLGLEVGAPDERGGREPGPRASGRLLASPVPGGPSVRLAWDGARQPGAGVDVFSVRGRLVASVSLAPDGTATWDGNDSGGRPAPSGVYFARGGGRFPRLRQDHPLALTRGAGRRNTRPHARRDRPRLAHRDAGRRAGPRGDPLDLPRRRPVHDPVPPRPPEPHDRASAHPDLVHPTAPGRAAAPPVPAAAPPARRGAVRPHRL